MSIELNVSQIRITVTQDLRGRMKAAAQQRATEIVEDAARGMVEDVLSHDITKEIEEGTNTASFSGTLDGGDTYPPKSLYGFIGFSAGDEPIVPIIERMDPNHPEGPTVELVGQSKNQYTFKVAIQKMRNAIYAATPLPWAPGLSWAKKIESYIPGFKYFLAVYGRPSSQSGGGIQAKDKDGNLIEVRSYDFTPPKDGYLTPIFDSFIARMKAYSKGGFKRRFKG